MSERSRSASRFWPLLLLSGVGVALAAAAMAQGPSLSGPGDGRPAGAGQMSQAPTSRPIFPVSDAASSEFEQPGEELPPPGTATPLAPATPRAPAAPAQQFQAPAANPPRPEIAARQAHALQSGDWRSFEQALKALGPLAASEGTARNGEVARFRLRLNDRFGSLEVDRLNNEVVLEGPPAVLAAWNPLVVALDRRPAGDTKVLPLERSEPVIMRKLVSVIERQAKSNNEDTVAIRRPKAHTAAAGPELRVAQNPQRDPRNELAQNAPAQAPAAAGAPAGEAVGQVDDAGLIGPVQIEFLEGLDVIVLRGNRRDVERVSQIIGEVEQLSASTLPVIEIKPLKNVDSVALLTLVAQIYEQTPALRQTRVSLTPLGKPNAVLLIGRREAVDTIIELIERLDQPVDPTTQFQVFNLSHTSASAAQTTLSEFFAERPGLGVRLRVSADTRSNSLIVQGGPRDLAEVALLLKRIDVPTSSAVNELRIFPLQNSLASDLAPVLQQAIVANSTGTPTAAAGAAGQPQPAPAGQAAGANASRAARSSMLRMMTIDAEGQRQIRSGILSDVRVTADPRGNSLVVSAPAESMDLISALIRQLDMSPTAEAQIKVFTIVNGDATTLTTMLETLFGLPSSGAGGQQGALPNFLQGGVAAQLQTAAAAGESSLVPLRFSVDQRTNSIVASGSAGDLNVVEAILLRLDDSDVRQRQSTVYRLKNAPAADVANAINNFLRSERQVQQVSPGLISPFEQIEREVVVVPETVSNSLIVSATPRYFSEIKKIVEQLDARPPLVIIQVLLAEVTMNNVDEFGIELGLQDSVLFDRSVVQTIATGGGTSLVPGYTFNNQQLGNSNSANSLASSDRVGGQGLTDFAVGRTNTDLGFGGLVLAASSESVSVLLRALNESRRTEVLARPQITTLDNQPAFIQVGQRVPTVTATNITTVGQTNSVTQQNVGLILGVTPRISPDGLVVMEIDAERSELSTQDGIPISISANGNVLRSPIINTTTAQTTVSALSGQTIVLGGLITKSRAEVHRRVPVLSDVPVLGNLFRYDSVTSRRTELLIIMTPRVIRSELDADVVKQVESSRMSWCLADIVKMHGPSGLRSRSGEWTDGEVPTVYPDLTPQGLSPEELHYDEYEEVFPPIGPDNGPNSNRPAVRAPSQGGPALTAPPSAGTRQQAAPPGNASPGSGAPRRTSPVERPDVLPPPPDDPNPPRIPTPANGSDPFIDEEPPGPELGDETRRDPRPRRLHSAIRQTAQDSERSARRPRTAVSDKGRRPIVPPAGVNAAVYTQDLPAADNSSLHNGGFPTNRLPANGLLGIPR